VQTGATKKVVNKVPVPKRSEEGGRGGRVGSAHFVKNPLGDEHVRKVSLHKGRKSQRANVWNHPKPYVQQEPKNRREGVS